MTATIENLAADLLTAINRRDLESVLSLLSPDYEGIDVGQAHPSRGPEGFRQSYEKYMKAFPDLSLSGKVLQEGDTIALWWVARGTHRGALLHIPATGRVVEIRGSCFLELEGGKIRRGLCIWDVAGFLRAIGLLPEL